MKQTYAHNRNLRQLTRIVNSKIYSLSEWWLKLPVKPTKICRFIYKIKCFAHFTAYITQLSQKLCEVTNVGQKCDIKYKQNEVEENNNYYSSFPMIFLQTWHCIRNAKLAYWSLVINLQKLFLQQININWTLDITHRAHDDVTWCNERTHDWNPIHGKSMQ